MEALASAATESPVAESIPLGDSSPSESSPSSEVNTSNLSDDALIEHFADKGKPEEAPAETADAEQAKPVEEAPKETAKTTEETKTEEEAAKPALAEPEREDMKKAFKSLEKWHPGVAKQLRDDHYAAKAFREQFTFPEVKELRQTFSSVQEAKDARAAMADLMAVEDALHSAPDKLLEHLSRNDPKGFANVATRLGPALYAMNPEAYRASVSGPAVGHYHDSLLARAEATGDDDLKTAIEIIRDRDARMSGGRPPSVQAKPQVDPALQRELDTYRERDRSREAQDVSNFEGAVNRDFDASLQNEIGSIITRSGAEMSEEAKNEVTSWVVDQIKDRLIADDILQRKVAFAIKSPNTRRDKQLLDRVVGDLVSNAKRFLPEFTAHRLTYMTDKILRLNREDLVKKAPSAPRRDPGGSAPGPGSGKQVLTKEQLDRLSPDQLIDYYAKS